MSGCRGGRAMDGFPPLARASTPPYGGTGLRVVRENETRPAISVLPGRLDRAMAASAQPAVIRGVSVRMVRLKRPISARFPSWLQEAFGNPPLLSYCTKSIPTQAARPSLS